MKKNIILICSTMLLLGLGGCSKNYLDVNNNPNSATNTTPELVLPQALTVTGSREVVSGPMPFVNSWMGYWAGSGSYAQSNGDAASYFQTTDFADNYFQALYHNLSDYNYIEVTATAEGKPFYQATAKIMKAYVFQRLVDMFGDIPYSQAFGGTTIIQPKYDKAADIYAALEKQIDSAIVLLKNPAAAGAATSTSDVMFAGSTSSWIAFANTLQLRILMRQSQVSGGPINLSGELANITANGGGFLTADASVNPGYANNAGQQNPLWGYFVTLTNQQTTGGNADYYRGNSYSINWLKTNNDTVRLKFIYSPGGGLGFIPVTTLTNTLNGTYKASMYVGNTLGSGSAGLGGNGASSYGPGLLKSVSQPSVLISAAESYFLQAEAAQKSWTGFSGAASLFNSGVLANFKFLGDPNAAADAAAYTSQANSATNYASAVGSSAQLAAIIRQKWIAMNGVNPFEAYCDYRRLGLPADIATAALSISTYLDTPPTIPVRFLYPTSEFETNTANVDAEGTINGHTSKIFWQP
jgi:hypothetical protein